MKNIQHRAVIIYLIAFALIITSSLLYAGSPGSPGCKKATESLGSFTDKQNVSCQKALDNFLTYSASDAEYEKNKKEVNLLKNACGKKVVNKYLQLLKTYWKECSKTGRSGW